MALGEILGLALAVAALLPVVKAGVDECRSLRDAPKELASFRRDLETHYAILTTVEAAIEEISSRPAGDRPELASILSIVRQASSDCKETASELKVVLKRTKGRFRAYFRGEKMSKLQQKLTSRTVTLTALAQALDRADRYYPSKKIVDRHENVFKPDTARNPPADPPPPYPGTQSRPVNVQNRINWSRIGKIALWTILGAASVAAAVYAVPFLVAYFTGGAVTGLGVSAIPTAALPWTAASYVSYATTLVSTLGNTAAASAAGTAVAGASAAALSGMSTMSALGITVLAQPAAALLPAAFGGILGGIWSARK